MKSILNLTSTLVLLSIVTQGNPVKRIMPLTKKVIFEVILEEGITSKPFLLVYKKEINQRDLSNTRKVNIQPKSNTGNSYTFELEDQSKPLYFSLLLTSYLMDVTIAREFHFEPGDHIKIQVNKTDVPNIYDLDFSGQGSAKYRCQNEFLYAKQIDSAKALPEPVNGNQYSKNDHTLRYTNILYDLIEKYQPEMSDYSYHLLYADVLGNMGKYVLSDLQVQLHDQLAKKDTAGFQALAKSFSDRYKFDFMSKIPDSVLSDSKEYALFMIEKIKTKVLIDFTYINYPIVYERIKRVENPVLRDKMIITLFKFYGGRFHTEYKSILLDALSVVKTKECLELLKNI
ncbi:hypothetical protein [Pedobacter sp. L105]|uniref:hypothetical protein n=1 Tax=Pedobacter sp. L105 TaxID=1641871 RepID=UPI00131C71C6|nr:hypothetical protein [Pedobacter sp. L105]